MPQSRNVTHIQWRGSKTGPENSVYPNILSSPSYVMTAVMCVFCRNETRDPMVKDDFRGYSVLKYNMLYFSPFYHLFTVAISCHTVTFRS